MTRTPHDETVIPYNTEEVTAAQVLAWDPAAGTASYRLPCATVRRGTALRLNSGGIEFGDPPPLRDLPDVASQLAFLNSHFQHQCGVWAKYARRFVDRYFAFVGAEIAGARAELEDRLAPFGTLYRPEQWAFSALRPLPRAHLYAPVGDEPPPDGLVRADVAFWSAHGPVAVDLVGRSTRGAREAGWRARLDAAGIRIVEITYDALDDGRPETLAALLPDDFRTFWRDQVLPAGPFRTETVLGAPPA